MSNSSQKSQPIEMNPMWFIGAGVLVLVLVVFLLFIKPGMDAARTAKEWSSPEAAAARSPEGRKADPNYENAVRAALEKEGRMPGAKANVRQ